MTLWEEGEDAAVPRQFTDALRRRATPKKLDRWHGGVTFMTSVPAGPRRVRSGL